mmetsp:Transcript_12064/g.28888  ORF Transcript_12064/g.28888 Transcript_12064/m.28888 type:complete len:82 (-) Transcript_12064:37-282(-)
MDYRKVLRHLTGLLDTVPADLLQQNHLPANVQVVNPTRRISNPQGNSSSHSNLPQDSPFLSMTTRSSSDSIAPPGNHLLQS